MNRPKPRRLRYPIGIIQMGDYPLLDELVSEGRIFRRITGLESSIGTSVVQREHIQAVLDRARETGQLEPLTSLAYFMVPGTANTKSSDLDSFLLPYQQHTESIMRELSENISLQVQMTPDNTWGEAVLNNGTLILKSGGKYIVYRYSVERGGTNRVAFERLPDLQSSDLETTVRHFHNPEAIESPVLIKSGKVYSTKGDILPYFAYRLTGLRR